MKLKLASLGLLALAPLAAQAEMVEMRDAELSDVNGQGFSWYGNANASWNGGVAGYDVTKTFSIFKDQYCQVWNVGGTNTVDSPYTNNTYVSSLTIGSDHGTNYIDPKFSWTHNQQ